MKMVVCDLCKKNYPDAKIKYKYKATKRFWCWGDYGRYSTWNRIELCQECLDKIIENKSKSRIGLY